MISTTFYYDLVKANVERIVTGPTRRARRASAYGFTETDGGKPDCWGHLAKYGWGHADGRGIDEFR